MQIPEMTTEHIHTTGREERRERERTATRVV